MPFALVLVSLVASAQPRELTTADLPPHLTRDLTAAQRELVASALHRAQVSCTDSAAQCLMRALSTVETAARLVRAGKPVAEVAAAVSDAPPADAAKDAPPKRLALKVPPGAPARGPENAPVTLMVWSDFQCPFCKRLAPTLEALRVRYGNSLRIVFRHQPLPFHNNAERAAQASVAAHRQGRFWEFHDALFRNQQRLDADGLGELATKLQLDLARFGADVDADETRELVRADIDEANAIGATGTPTCFVNGLKVVGAQPVDSFIKVIDAELRAAGKAVPSGR
jgi:protein-disulfide isomerase